jgi:ribokinase
MKILNFGSLNLDYVYRVDHFAGPGETLSALSREVKPGGKGLNQSIALARAGAKVYHAGCLGKGGELLRELLEQDGVDTSLLRPVGEMQGHTVIQVDPEGENSILLYGGSNRCVTEAQAEETLAGFRPGDWLLLQNEISMNGRIVDRAYERGMRIVLNPSPYDGRLAEVDFAKLSWVLVNEVEAEQMTGTQDPEQAWEIMHRRWPELSAVITLGSRGSMAFAQGEGGTETVRQEAVKVRAADTTAAGDTFTGYFIAGRAAGKPLRECMAQAALAAAVSVTRPGAADSIPRAEELEKGESGR